MHSGSESERKIKMILFVFFVLLLVCLPIQNSPLYFDPNDAENTVEQFEKSHNCTCAIGVSSKYIFRTPYLLDETEKDHPTLTNIGKSAGDFATGIVKKVPEILPSFHHLFERGKNYLAGYPFETVSIGVAFFQFSHIHTVYYLIGFYNYQQVLLDGDLRKNSDSTFNTEYRINELQFSLRRRSSLCTIEPT